MKRLIIASSLLPLCLCLAGCNGETSSETANTNKTELAQSSSQAEVLRWEDLMPEGEDEILAELYSDFYEEQEMRMIEQMTLADAARTDTNLMSLIEEGSAQDTMEQIGTYNVVEDLDGQSVRLPGYVVPLDFNAASEYQEFLLVPYFGACLHTPPPPPNQIVFVKSETATKITDIYEPVWIEGVMKTGKFGSDLGNSAYEITLSKLEPYVY